MILSLENFYINIVYYDNNSKENYILLSSYKDGLSSPTGTYNENLTEKANGQYSLSFDIEMYVNGQLNPFLKYIAIDRKLRLIRNNTATDFVITGRTPTFGSKGIVYRIDCQDSFSHRFSRQKISLSFSTEDEELWGKNQTGPKTITQLINKVFEVSDATDWKIDPEIDNNIYSFPDNLFRASKRRTVTVDISNSTPYNIIIEISNLFNAIMVVDYLNKELKFYNKEKMLYKGLILKPEVNLNSFSFGEKGDNLYNILHIHGGEDAEGNYIGIMPSMPNTLSDFIINLDFDNKRDTITNWAKGRDPQYYINNSGKLCNKGEELETAKNWKELTREEMRAWFLSLYNGIENPMSTWGEIDSYFNVMEKVPQCSSFLYNFDYWKNNYLLNEQRYNNLIRSLEIDLRNINLITNAYTLIYNKYNYMLNKLIDQEEELISLMAAEEELRANFDSESNKSTTEYYYISQSEVYSHNAKETYFLPIGTGENNNIVYGKFVEGRSSYKLPEFSLFTSGVDSIELFYIDSNLTPVSLDNRYNYDEDLQIFELEENVNGKTIYAILSDIPIGDMDETMDIDGITQFNIEEYQTQLHTLWNEDYKYYYRMIYGSNWLEDKISNIRELKNKKESKKEEVLSKMRSQFGDSWQSADSVAAIKQNMSRYIDYSDLLAQLNDLSTYIGGEGKRLINGTTNQYYTYSGYYNVYLSMLEVFKNSVDTISNTKPLKEIMENLKRQREKWEDSFYNTYSDIIRETEYSDEAQLTAEGLYSSAYAQFLSYMEPARNYSASYIDISSLDGYGSEISVGDRIKVQHKDLFRIKATDSLVFNFADEGKVFKRNERYELVYKDKNGDKACSMQFIKKEDNNFYFKADYINLDTDKVIIKSIGDYSFNNSDHRILFVDNDYNNKNVELRVTGISKDLRSNDVKLTVEENTLYNTMVDRLVWFLKNK